MAMVKKHHAWKVNEPDVWLYGEDLYGVHSIEYEPVAEHETFYAFALRHGDGAFASFAKVEAYAKHREIPVVPVLFRGRFRSVAGIRAFMEQAHGEASMLGGSGRASSCGWREGLRRRSSRTTSARASVPDTCRATSTGPGIGDHAGSRRGPGDAARRSCEPKSLLKHQGPPRSLRAFEDTRSEYKRTGSARKGFRVEQAVLFPRRLRCLAPSQPYRDRPERTKIRPGRSCPNAVRPRRRASAVGIVGDGVALHRRRTQPRADPVCARRSSSSQREIHAHRQDAQDPDLRYSRRTRIARGLERRLDEAVAMARDCIEGFLARLAESGESIPVEPESADAIAVRMEVAGPVAA